MAEEKSNEALKNELLEKQIHDVVAEFESLKHLNLEYLRTNERLNHEINNLKELNEQQVILNDTMIDSNKEIFKGSKRNIFWLVTICTLVAILLSFQLIDKRIDDKIEGKAKEAIKNINSTLKTSNDSLALSKKLQLKIQSYIENYENIKELHSEQLKISQKQFLTILNNFKSTTLSTNNSMNEIRNDYALALKNFKILLTKKETELEDLKKNLIEKVEKTSPLNKKTIIPNKTIKKAILKKPDTVYDLLQKAFKYQKKQQYSNAIKMYKGVLKIDPKKDIAYYNLGIIYGNQKKYDLAVAAYKKSLDINPDRNLTYTNIFEIQLINNEDFDKTILKIYKDHNKNKKTSLIKYEMLDILRDVKHHKNIDKKLHNWKKEYKTTSLGSWSFVMLKNWVKEEKDKTTQNNLNLVLKTFETHK